MRPIPAITLAFTAALLLLGGCESTRGSAHPKPGSIPDSTSRTTGLDRPGLGTRWGEDRVSWVETSEFVRGSSSPTAKDWLFYNDENGIRAMLAYHGGEPRRMLGLAPAANGMVSFGLRDGDGRWLEAWDLRGRRFVTGERGRRYEIVLKNNTRRRLELVISVDGLDVLDGRSASTGKRGYILGPRETLEVEGFRTSDASVASFRFGSVAESYASVKHNDPRNVGVIGVAVFQERWFGLPAPGGSDAWRRTQARPFPSSRGYASPPDA